MSVKFRLASLCLALVFGFVGLSFFANQSPQEVLPQRVLMPPNLTCKSAIYAVPVDSVFVKVDSLVSSIDPNVTYTLRRMPNNYCLAKDTLPSDSILICCADIRDTFVTIIVTAKDAAGDSVTCMTRIEIQDKLPPIISVELPDVTVSCTFPFNFSKLDTFGRYIHPDSISRTNVFEDGQEVTDLNYIDFCPVTVTSTYGDFRNCGTGTIERYFTLTDLSANIRRDTQVIHVVNTIPFTGNNIAWPRDTTIILGPNQCLGDNPPMNFGGMPIITGQSTCVMPSVTKKDMVFDDPISGCPYIMRTWRVIEMCTYRPNSGVGSYEHVQNIYVQDTIKPTFSSVCKDTTFSDPNNKCEVLINLTASAIDNCTKNDDILYSFSIAQNGIIILTGDTNTINHVLTLGDYTVTWTIDDRCGNTNTCSHNLRVADIKPPTPLANISLVIGLPAACAVDLKAASFNVNSSDNCTPAHLLRYSFSQDVNDTIVTLGCNELGNNTLQFWVTDLFGNQDKVNVKVNVQDNYNHCPNNQVVKIDGLVMMDENHGLGEVKIILEGAEQQRAVMTDDNGTFSMSNLESNVSYFLTTNKSGEFLEGVNILDLIELQKDFYNIKKLENNRQKIAADINGDGVINHLDLSELRKIILGIIEPSENTPTWRIVDYGSMAMSNPWPLKESFLFRDLNKDEHLQLQAIKIGDIDGTAVRKLQSRNDGKIVWYYPDQRFVEGEKVTAFIHSAEDVPLTGIHLLLHYQSDVLIYKNTNGVNVTLGADDLNPNINGKIKLCHINAKGSNIRSESQVFSIEFVAKKAGKLSEVIELSSIESSYVVNAKDDLLYLNLVSLEPADKVMFVAQNVPNPFDRFTSLSFEVKEDMPVEISIMDHTGRKVHRQYNQYTKGRHSLEISDQQLGDLTGVFFVHIECAEVSEVRKILRVK